MNKAQKILSDIKLLFENIETTIPVAPVVPIAQVQLEKATLQDGMQVEYDKLEVGGVMTMDGMPCMPGDFTFEDGTIVSVGDAGVIANVTPAAVVEVEPVEAATAPVAATNTPVQDSVLMARVEVIEAAILELQKTRIVQTANIKAQSDILKQMFSLMDEFSGKPIEDTPIQKKVFSFSRVEGKTSSLTKFQDAAAKLQAEFIKIHN